MFSNLTLQAKGCLCSQCLLYRIICRYFDNYLYNILWLLLIDGNTLGVHVAKYYIQGCRQGGGGLGGLKSPPDF